VCRRWRSVVFQSPRRLNLRLFCTPATPARDTLDIWPPLPLIIRFFDEYIKGRSPNLDNIIAALEHNDRVCQIDLSCFTSSEMGYITDSVAMLKPFPELTDLQLTSNPLPKLTDLQPMSDLGTILPDSFLGGTAPRLRSLYLERVTFPGLPKLLLSATHLVDLSLDNITSFGYIPPEVMATSLSALTSLKDLYLHFLYPRPRPALESRRPPPLTRSILPSLTRIHFHGVSEYLEEILARIDAPRLDKMHITLFNQIIFDTTQLFQFISRTPTLRAPERGYIEFRPECAVVQFPSQTSVVKFPLQTYLYEVLTMEILCKASECIASEWQLSFLEQAFTSSLPPVSTLEDLYISFHVLDSSSYPPHRQDDDENTLWLELLHPFAAVKNLYIGKEFVPRIARALQELGGGTTEVLPALENIFLEFQPSGPLHKGIEKFVAARQLTSHPVAVSRWDRNYVPLSVSCFLLSPYHHDLPLDSHFFTMGDICRLITCAGCRPRRSSC
jgi:hypothetical protein